MVKCLTTGPSPGNLKRNLKISEPGSKIFLIMLERNIIILGSLNGRSGSPSGIRATRFISISGIPRSQHDHLRGNDLGGIPFDTVFVFPVPGLYSALDVYLFAFSKIFVAMLKLATARPLGVYRTSGSRPKFPIRMALFKPLAIFSSPC
jgi:hypothetical protein